MRIRSVNIFRLKISIAVANLAKLMSKVLLGRTGENIAGKILLMISPDALVILSAEVSSVVLSGTNGKTSTSKALAQSISSLGKVATSASGSNLPRGAASALMNKAPFAVLEIDELHLPQLLKEANPKVVLLLNLTRDQLHRMHEVKRVADLWYKAATSARNTTFVIDVDDPFLNYATKDAAIVLHISFGGRRHPDGAVCPACGAYLNWRSGIYDCSCGLTNKSPDRLLPDGSAAYRNATLANIAAELMGAKPIPVDEKALERSITKDYAGVTANIRLTKNPASWAEALRGVDSQDVILVVNARQVEGIDTSWLWDVSFTSLKGRNVVVTGERALDIAYRLHVEGIEAEVVDTFEKAVKMFPRGRKVSVLAAYTAFFGLVSK